MKEQIKKYWQYIAIIILLIAVYTCSNNREYELKGEVKQLNEQLKKSTDGLKVFRKKQQILFDSISLTEKIKNKRIVELQKSNTILNKKLQDSQEKLKQKKESYKNKTYQQLAEVFKESGYKDVNATNTSVNLEKDSPIEVLDDLAEGIHCFEDLQTKDSIINNKNEEIKLTNEKVLNRDLQIASKQMEVDKLNQGLEISQEINKKQEKENKQLKRKNFITTYIVPPLAFVVGFLIPK